MAHALASWKAGRVPLRDSLSGTRRGQVVRVRGTIAATRTFPSGLGEQGAVLAIRYGRTHAGRSRQEARAVPFTLALPGGDHVTVSMAAPDIVEGSDPVPDEFEGDPPEPPPGGDVGRTALALLLAEDRFSPGDRVEVCGTVDFSPLPGALSGGFRADRLGPQLIGRPGRPLVLRRLDPSNG
jgi:hypothetical protein